MRSSSVVSEIFIGLVPENALAFTGRRVRKSTLAESLNQDAVQRTRDFIEERGKLPGNCDPSAALAGPKRFYG
jgi:hypothetical protein